MMRRMALQAGRNGIAGVHMTSIGRIRAREILDSRGYPTIEVDVQLRGGAFGRAAVPSGLSIGAREAFELRDGDNARYGGRGVRRAVEFVNEVIGPALHGLEDNTTREFDQRLIELDGTADKSRLGANTMLAVSLAVTRALAHERDQTLYNYLAVGSARRLPVPMFNVLNGGAHAGNTVDLEDFMIAPVGARDFSEAVRMGAETYHALKALLRRAGKTTAVGDEGGFAPDLGADVEAIEFLLQGIERAGLRPGKDVVVAIDAAASSLYDHDSYVFRKSLRRRRSREQMIHRYEEWVRHFPIWSIEDAMADRDTEGWRALCLSLSSQVQLVGDDLFATSAALIREAASHGVANAVLIKLNQIGTVSETLDAVTEARQHGYDVIISHRSGETTDDFIADLAVAVGAGQIKTGAPVRGERVAKYNQLLRIEEALGEKATYAGRDFISNGSFKDHGFTVPPQSTQTGTLVSPAFRQGLV
jgi:enolase